MYPDEVDLARLEPYFDRCRRSVVTLIIESDDDGQPFLLGSGVLALLGGREFVLTAGHNVWSKTFGRQHQLAVALPSRTVDIVIQPGDGSAGAVFHPTPALPDLDPEPDVAAIEVTTKTMLPRLEERRPFNEDEIEFLDPAVMLPTQSGQGRGHELVVSGFPMRHLKYDPSAALPPSIRTFGSLAAGLQSLRVTSIPTQHGPQLFAAEPSKGRGFHVYLALLDPMPIEALKCMSGGPAIVPVRAGALVGLMRGAMQFEGGWDEWCEPAAEAVRLLIGHDDREVRAAAARVCERYDKARAGNALPPY